jgi:hypothetical protein
VQQVRDASSGNSSEEKDVVVGDALSQISKGDGQQRSGSEFKFGATKRRTSSHVVGEGSEGNTQQRMPKAKVV